MKYLSGTEVQEAEFWIHEAVKIAKQATCERSKCGSIVVLNGQILGVGFNSPPKHLESQKRCLCSKDSYHKKVTDKTCCVHAEQRAIVNALSKYQNLSGSRLYFIRLDENDSPQNAGKPYCTICSKMALDSGISEFVLSHDEGICVYNTEEYNTLSYQYQD